MIVVLHKYITTNHRMSKTLSYYFKKAIDDMELPANLHTMKDFDVIIKEAMKEAKKNKEENSWRTLYMTYSQFCYVFDFDENHNKLIKFMDNEYYDEECYEVEFKFIEDPDMCRCVMIYECVNSLNKKIKITKKTRYSGSSPFAMLISSLCEDCPEDDEEN